MNVLNSILLSSFEETEESVTTVNGQLEPTTEPAQESRSDSPVVPPRPVAPTRPAVPPVPKHQNQDTKSEEPEVRHIQISIQQRIHSEVFIILRKRKGLYLFCRAFFTLEKEKKLIMC